jgi:thioredoxin 2
LADRGRCGACKANLGPLDAALDVDAATFEDVIQNARVPVLVDFWAPWCGPCRSVAPEVQRLASEVAGEALVLKLNTDTHPDLAARYGVSGIPNFIVFSGRQVLAQQSGAMGRAALQRMLRQAVSP